MAKRERPDVLKGKTEKIKTGCGNLYLTINEDEDGSPYEVRAQIGKSGSCARSMLEVIGILMSIIFQNVDKEIVTKSIKRHLRGVSCGSEFKEGDKRRMSCLDVIAQRALVSLKEEEE